MAEGNKKRVRCIETGKVYGSAKEAAEETGMSPAMVSSICRGVYYQAKGLSFEYIDPPKEKVAKKRRRSRDELDLIDELTMEVGQGNITGDEARAIIEKYRNTGILPLSQRAIKLQKLMSEED